MVAAVYSKPAQQVAENTSASHEQHVIEAHTKMPSTIWNLQKREKKTNIHTHPNPCFNYQEKGHISRI